MRERHTPLIIFPGRSFVLLNMSNAGVSAYKYLLSWLLYFKYPHTPCLSISHLPSAVYCSKYFIIVAFSFRLHKLSERKKNNKQKNVS